MKFRPCIDIHNGKVKQIVGSTLKDDPDAVVENFVAERGAEYYAEMFKNDKLSGGHIIMLGPGNEEQALKALKVYPGGLQIGGGITAENASYYIEYGASHVIVTSYVFANGELNINNLNRIVSEVGKEKLVLDLSCRKKEDTYFVVTDRWQKISNFEINKENLKELSSYCDEFLIHAVDVEGQCRGVQKDLVAKLGQWASIPITYAGGARTFSDLRLVYELGREKLDLTIGSALDIFGGNLSYQKVLEWFRKREEEKSDEIK
ncbi:MAG: phosphoribosylformimino-5-aminoimidazole carboxamide ribotide isomerase [Clostridiaceae bacterium]|jgi:phosphoribosylformimino-5-aminoimidazole carboxamide ribotide isomerase|nr:phosphoribosylformimino-5-aminoimidazole carboxamide ribotide isomerase [Clostridiaceae bacterium]